MDLFLDTLSGYTRAPPPEAVRYKAMVRECLIGTIILESPFDHVLFSGDYGGDSDDIALALMLYRAHGNFTMIVSEPAHERLDILKAACDEFKDAEFGKKTGPLLFLPDSPDGVALCDLYDIYVNCGPVTGATLVNIRAALKSPATVVTVGANADGSKTTPPGINQKSDNWNEVIASVPRIHNIPPSLSRFVLMPNPGVLGVSAAVAEEMLDALCMMVVSRASPTLAISSRLNDANSVLIGQLLPYLNLADKMTLDDADMRRGLQTYEAYTAIGGGPEAIVPIVVTCLLGGVFLPVIFGYSPLDLVAKRSLGNLTPVSGSLVRERLKNLPFYTPGYDPLACLTAFKY